MSSPDQFESSDDEIEFDIDVVENDEGEPEVDLADEDAEPESEQEQEPEPKAEAEESEQQKPHRNRAKERIAELSRRAAEAEHRAAEAERKASQYEQRMAAANVAQVEQAETALKSELAYARKELIEAKALGDYEKEAEATAKMAELSATMAQVRMYREANPAREERQAERAVPSQPIVEPRTASWINENSWFNPQSPDYDAEMAVDAQAYARKLEIRLTREGRQNEIGSAEYFAVIDDYVREQNPEVFEDAPPPQKKRMPSMSAGRDVAPVARQTAPVQPAPKKNSVRLTADQRDMAERMFPNLQPQQAWTKYARHQ